MSKVELKITLLGLVLPSPLELPSNNRTSAVRTGNTLYLSGHGSDLLENETDEDWQELIRNPRR